jgi:hypothetical protein
MQPVAGVLYLYQRLADEPHTNFTPDQSQLIADAYGDITDVFKAQPDNLRMLVRIGQGEPPSARAQKHIPIILLN